MKRYKLRTECLHDVLKILEEFWFADEIKIENMKSGDTKFPDRYISFKCNETLEEMLESIHSIEGADLHIPYETLQLEEEFNDSRIRNYFS